MKKIYFHILITLIISSISKNSLCPIFGTKGYRSQFEELNTTLHEIRNVINVNDLDMADINIKIAKSLFNNIKMLKNETAFSSPAKNFFFIKTSSLIGGVGIHILSDPEIIWQKFEENIKKELGDLDKIKDAISKEIPKKEKKKKEEKKPVKDINKEVSLKIFKLTNNLRQTNELPPFKWNENLTKIAEDYSKEMSKNWRKNPMDGLTHDGFYENRLPKFPKKFNGKGLSQWGENVGLIRSHAKDPAEEVMTQWIISKKEHLQNLIDKQLNTIGIGAFRHESGDWYITQLFARY